MFNLLKIMIIHCICINNGGVKISVKLAGYAGKSGCNIMLTLFVGGLNWLL